MANASQYHRYPRSTNVWLSAPVVAAMLLASPATAQQSIATHGGLPRVSPDGKQVAFVSDRDGNDEVYVIGADGTHERRVTKTAENESAPRWTRDGSHVLYSVESGDSSTLYRDDVGGSGRERLGTYAGRSPALLTDGRVLSSIGGWRDMQLAVSDAAGAGVRRVSDGTGAIYNAEISPDGKQVAYTRSDTGLKIAVWIMNVDGSSARPVTQFTEQQGRAQVPSWSPDGRRLAFQAAAADPADPKRRIGHVWILDVATGAARKLATHTEAYLDETPTWFPDGRRLAYQSNRTGSWEIWIMNTDGTGQRQVTRARAAPAREQ